MFRKCERCGVEINFGDKCLMKDYPFRRRVRDNNKTHYFCSYGCMRTAEKGSPDLYVKRREK